MQRVRIRYGKTEAMRYTSNLDIHKTWERILRRAHMPLVYSQGFHPQPRLQQAFPLPLGIISQVEMIDAWFEPDQSLDKINASIKGTLPPGIILQQVDNIDLKAPPLQTQVQFTEYDATLQEEHPDLFERVQDLLKSSTIPRHRRGKYYDLRPLINHLALLGNQEDPHILLRMRLLAREGATGRPDEVIDALGLEISSVRLERTRLILIGEVI